MYVLHKIYLYATLVLLFVEISIAAFIKNGFIRYTFGDFLATILVYCAIKSCFKLKSKTIAYITISIAFTLECFQYFNLLEILSQQHYKWLKIVLGSHFSIEDLIAYTLGTLCIYFIDLKTSTNDKIIKSK